MTFKAYQSRAEALEVIEAIDKALGNPRPPTHIGRNAAKYIPSEYVPGAIGWTETECSVEEHEDKTVLVLLTASAVSLGKRDVQVKGKLVQLDLTVDVGQIAQLGAFE